jgi:hypothetical protein
MQAAYDAICATLPLGSVGYENEVNERGERFWLERAVVGPSSIPSLGDGVMLSTAWIDRPVDTRGCTPLPRPFRAAWKCSHARAICDR